MRSLVLILILVSTAGCSKQAASSDDATPRAVAPPDACRGKVEEGARCQQDGMTCRFNGRMGDIAPVSVPGEPPECICASGAWSCPHVASPAPPGS